MDAAQNIRFPELSPLDGQELAECIPARDLTLEPQTAEGRPGTSNEPFTTVAVVLLSAAAIRGIAAWMLKKRHRKEVEIEIEREDADGSRVRQTVRVNLSESSTEAEVIDALSQQVSFDPNVLSAALREAAG